MFKTHKGAVILMGYNKIDDEDSKEIVLSSGRKVFLPKFATINNLIEYEKSLKTKSSRDAFLDLLFSLFEDKEIEPIEFSTMSEEKLKSIGMYLVEKESYLNLKSYFQKTDDKEIFYDRLKKAFELYNKETMEGLFGNLPDFSLLSKSFQSPLLQTAENLGWAERLIQKPLLLPSPQSKTNNLLNQFIEDQNVQFQENREIQAVTVSILKSLYETETLLVKESSKSSKIIEKQNVIIILLTFLSLLIAIISLLSSLFPSGN